MRKHFIVIHSTVFGGSHLKDNISHYALGVRINYKEIIRKIIFFQYVCMYVCMYVCIEDVVLGLSVHFLK